MKWVPTGTPVFAACLVLFFSATAFAAKYRTQQWRAVEIVLTSTVAYGNPFQDVDVTATFTGPDHRVIARPAFWDGGRIWKVRFAPPQTGVWKMTTGATDAKTRGSMESRRWYDATLTPAILKFTSTDFCG
jgi:hypothetical protein